MPAQALLRVIDIKMKQQIEFGGGGRELTLRHRNLREGDRLRPRCIDHHHHLKERMTG